MLFRSVRPEAGREALAAHLTQIERINPKVNAIVTLVPELASAAAARADEMQARSLSFDTALADLASLLEGGLRDIFTTIAGILSSEPIAFTAFLTVFAGVVW